MLRNCQSFSLLTIIGSFHKQKNQRDESQNRLKRDPSKYKNVPNAGQ